MKIALIVILCISYTTCQATFRKVAVPDLNALCLDGSIAAYYIHDVGTNP